MPMAPGELQEPRPAPANFQAFLASLFLSKIADQILLFLVPLVVFQTTQDVGWSGLAFALETFPRFLSFPVCGALCDRVSPVRLMRWSQLWRGAVCVAGALLGHAFGGVGWLIAASAICGVLTTQGLMAQEVILPRAFHQHRFEKVLAYSQTADQSGAVLGPVLAALLLAWGPWQAVVGGTAAIFLLADAAASYWRRGLRADDLGPHAGHRGKHLVGDLVAAAAHLIRLPGLRRLVIQAAGVNLVVGVTLASSAALVTGLHAQSTAWYGALQTAGATATVLILMGIAHTRIPAHRLGLAGFMLIALGGLLTAVSTAAWGYALGFLLVIGFDKMFSIYMRSSRQRIIPASDYGKTTGVMALLNNLAQPLAGLAVGAFAAPWGVGRVILALTAAMLALGALSMLAGRAAAERVRAG
ncbi:MFS transporter [Variovorax sp. LARHSF232]